MREDAVIVPIIVSQDNIVLDGRTRLKAAKQFGLAKIEGGRTIK